MASSAGGLADWNCARTKDAGMANVEPIDGYSASSAVRSNNSMGTFFGKRHIHRSKKEHIRRFSKLRPRRKPVGVGRASEQRRNSSSEILDPSTSKTII
jgi:hypothetical protein